MKRRNTLALAPFLFGAMALGLAPQTLALPKKEHPAKAPVVKPHETIGGGTVTNPAAGPAPSFGIGGPGMVLVKNWHFGTGGTVKNAADMSANFYYHDQFGTINNGGKYGSNIVSPDFENSVRGQPVEGVNSPSVRRFTADSLQTFLTPLDKTARVQVWNHNTGNGSFMAKWRLPNGGPTLGQDIVWETRVRYKTPPYYWFGLWTAGRKWKWDGQAQGAEQDLVESFGYDNGGGNTNYDGRFWHSNSVASPSKDTVDYSGWGTAMEKLGIKNYDAAQYHIWTWLYKKDGTFAMYVDGTKVQSGSNYYWGYGSKAGDEPIDMDFLFDGGWGHNQIGSVNKELPASAFDGKFYEWNYSRVYLSGNKVSVRNGPHVLPGTVQGADYDREASGSRWHNYTVQVPTGGHYRFSFQAASLNGGTFHLEDENGVNLSGSVFAPKKAATETASVPAVLSAGAHTLKWVQDSGVSRFESLTAAKVPGSSARFVRADRTTQGSWKGVYGADGYLVAGDEAHPPGYGSVTRTGWAVTWSGSTSDIRAPQKAGGGTDRVAGQWGTNDPAYDIGCSLTDGAAHQVSLYGLDWDLNGRSEDIQVLDAATGAVLDTQDLNAYNNGTYLVWNIQGSVIFRVKVTSHWTNPALSGIFFDPAHKGQSPNIVKVPQK